MNFLDETKNPSFENTTLLRELCDLFKGHKDAAEFILIYCSRAGLIDDLVDEKYDVNVTRKHGQLTALMFNSAYWKKWGQALAMTDRLISFTYYDSVAWERDTVEWKRRYARALSHCGIDMIIAVMILEFGEEITAPFSIRLREEISLSHAFDTYDTPSK